MTPAERRILHDDSGVGEALERMSREIVQFAGGTDRLVLVGIQRRGSDLAERLCRMIAEAEGTTVPLGVMDITLYRDDLQTIGPGPWSGKPGFRWISTTGG